jgi:hypothetical protein
MASDDDSRWRARYSALRAFQHRNGNTDVPLRWPEEPALGSWVCTQRRKGRDGRLRDDRRRLLLALGFTFYPRDAQWEGYFDKLAAFRRAHGHCEVSQRFKDDPRLGEWVARQRQLWKRGELASEKQRRLEKAGFAFKAFDARWARQCGELAQYQVRHGHCRVPDDGTPLGRWCESLRDQARSGALAPSRRAQLEALGFCFYPARARRQAFWEARLAELARLGAELGHLRLRPTQVRDWRLRSWIVTQRHLHARRRLDPERERRLLELGFSFNTKVDRWDARAAEVGRFIRENGPWLNPPRSGATLLLARWIDVQRTLYAKDKLPAKRVRALETIGFAWSLRAQLVQTQEARALAELVSHRARQGHFWPCPKEPATRWLAEWAQRARERFRAGRLPPALEERLREMDFPFEPKDARWEQLFARLQSYRARRGRNPGRGDTELGRWLGDQENLWWAGELELDRERRLEALGAIEANRADLPSFREGRSSLAS